MGENNKRWAGGIRWDNVAEKILKDIGGDQEEVLSTEKFGGVQDRSKRKNRRKGKASPKK